MEWLAVAIPAAGLLGLMLGCTLGAWMGGVSLWKGSAVGIGGSVTQAVLSELVIKPLTMIDNILLDYALFFVVAGGIAHVLNIGAKATALIVVGAFLGMMTFALVAFHLVLSQIGG